MAGLPYVTARLVLFYDYFGVVGDVLSEPAW
jgi:hypothetical protein